MQHLTYLIHQSKIFMLHRLRARGNMLHVKYSGYENNSSPFLDPHYGEIYYEMPLPSTPHVHTHTEAEKCISRQYLFSSRLLTLFICQLSVRILVLKQCVYDDLQPMECSILRSYILALGVFSHTNVIILIQTINA